MQAVVATLELLWHTNPDSRSPTFFPFLGVKNWPTTNGAEGREGSGEGPDTNHPEPMEMCRAKGSLTNEHTMGETAIEASAS